MRYGNVSVVIPSYNCARYIGESIRSVLAQTYQPAEIIVVDDGSTDATAAALGPYRDRICYLRQENRGEPAARNLGMKQASGEYIAFLDADDLWLPDKLELQMRYFDDNPDCAMVYTDMSTFDENGLLDASVKVRFHITFPSGNIFRSLFRETLFGSGSVVFRRKCLEKVGWFDESLLVGSDYEMWLRIAREFNVGVVDKPLLKYRQHTAMSTRRMGKKTYQGLPWEVAVLQKILQRYPGAAEELGKTTVKRRLSHPYSQQAHNALAQGDHLRARSLFRTAIGYWPANLHYWGFLAATFLSPTQIVALRRMYRRLFTSSTLAAGNGSQAQVSS